MEKKPTKRSSVPLCKDHAAGSLSHWGQEFCSTRKAFRCALRPRYWGKLAVKAPEGLEPLVMVTPQGLQWEPAQGPKEDIWI